MGKGSGEETQRSASGVGRAKSIHIHSPCLYVRGYVRIIATIRLTSNSHESLKEMPYAYQG